MKKPFAYSILLFLLLAACQKSVDSAGTISFTMNGKQYTASANYCEFNYYNGKFSVLNFAIVNGKPDEGYFNLQIGSPNGTAFSSVYQTDSLVTGTNYHPSLLNYTLDSVRVIQSSSFTMAFSNLLNNTVDGSFSGIVTGVDTTTSTLIIDTITNGAFTHIPIQRVYH